MTAARGADRGVFHYAFAAWRRSPERGPTVFSVHERSAYGSVVVGLLIVVAVELLPVHLLLSRWSLPAAWLATALSLYGGLWLIADWQATRLRPIRLTPEALTLRAGLRWNATIPIEDIEAIERPGRGSHEGPQPLRLGAFGDPDLIVRLRRPVAVRGLYGISKSAESIAIEVDEPRRLVEAWRAAAPRRSPAPPEGTPA